MVAEKNRIDIDENITIPPQKESFDHLKALGPTESLRLHSLLLLTATNTIRRKIANGDWDTRHPREWFFDMYGYHIGADRNNSAIYHLIARYEPSQGGGRTRTVLDLADHIEALHDGQLSPKGFERKKLRESDMNMVRRGKVLGVPKDILPSLADTYFASVSHFLDREKQSSDESEAHRERNQKLSLALAFILDFIHLKPDCNGRTTEDFMVQMQRVLLHGDMQHIRTWSQHGLRAKEVSRVLAPPYDTQVLERKEAMEDRSDKAVRILRAFYVLIQDSFRSEGIVQNEEGLSDEALNANADIVENIFSDIIIKITRQPDEFLKEDFVTLGFENLWKTLVAHTPADENGHTYDYQEFDFYETHTEAQEVFSKLQKVIHYRQRKARLE